jgi:DNA-binding transcriptional regulator YhcF (GntR family)
MTISVHAGSPVPMHEQIRYQIELRILGGELSPGAALPSVRTLARTLRLSPGTVAAAYRDLEDTGRVVSRPGAGLFVAPPPASAQADTQAACHAALDALVRGGHSVENLRAAMRTWAEPSGAVRLVAVDTTLAMAELLAAEVEQGLGWSVVAQALETLSAHEDSGAEGAIFLTPPYHAAAVRRQHASARVETLHIQPSPRYRAVIAALPPDSLVLVVAHAAAVLPFARAVVHGVRGEDVTLLTHERGERERWAGAAHAAALVLADTLTFQEACAAGLTNAIELRLLSPASLDGLAERLGPPPS